jgi:tetratricopeptide (TPR) repeat protein
MADLANHLTWIGDYKGSAEVASRALELNDANHIPPNGLTMEIAARAYKHLGDYDKALALYNDAVKRKADSGALHGIALQIAALRHDQQGVDREIAWSRGTADESRILQQAGMAALFDGRARESDRLFAEAAIAAKRDNQQQDLAVIEAYRTRILVEMGLNARAKELADAFHQPDIYMDWLYAEAELGDPGKARAEAIRRQKEAPQDTLVNAEYAPSVYAALALRSGKPSEAIDQMQASEPYELRDPTICYLRGQAFLAAKMTSQAEAEFQKLIDNPGIDDPLTPLHALAHLNLARALTLDHKPDRAKAEYAEFLREWSAADPDLPPLKQARAELDQLPTHP